MDGPGSCPGFFMPFPLKEVDGEGRPAGSQGRRTLACRQVGKGEGGGTPRALSLARPFC